MRKFRPPFLGQDNGDWFSWVGTSPGRLDPATGELVETTAVSEKERTGMFDWIETSAGRINPRTGKLVVPTTLPKEQREKLKRPAGAGEGVPGRAFSRFGGQVRRELPAPRPGSRELIPAGEEQETPGGWGLFGPPRMNGPYGIGYDTYGMGEGRKDGGPGAVLWIFLGVTAAIALEALGVTAWSKK